MLILSHLPHHARIQWAIWRPEPIFWPDVTEYYVGDKPRRRILSLALFVILL